MSTTGGLRGTKYSSLNVPVHEVVTLTQAKSQRTGVRSCDLCGLITIAETSFKKVRKAFQYVIYHLIMNSVTELIDSKEKTIF